MIEIGMIAPDFTLPDKNGNPVVLAQTGDYLSNIGKMTINGKSSSSGTTNVSL